MSPRRKLAVVGSLGALLALGTFRLMAPDNERPARPEAPPNAYAFDPARGETRASVRGEDGTVTTLYSGQTVQPRLPDGFTLLPGAEVLEHSRVERDGGSRTLITFSTERPVTDVAAFYRAQASAAGVEFLADISAPQAATLTGRGPDGLDFAFSARREGDRTRAQVTVGQGL